MWEPARHVAISRVGQDLRGTCPSPPCVAQSKHVALSGSPLVCDHHDFIPSEMASRHLLCLTGSAWNASSPALCASFQMLNATGSSFVCDHHCFIPSEMACRDLSCWLKSAWNLSIPALCSSAQARSASGFFLVCTRHAFVLTFELLEMTFRLGCGSLVVFRNGSTRMFQRPAEI